MSLGRGSGVVEWLSRARLAKAAASGNWQVHYRFVIRAWDGTVPRWREDGWVGRWVGGSSKVSGESRCRDGRGRKKEVIIADVLAVGAAVVCLHFHVQIGRGLSWLCR